jgi:hypothetical protein
MYSRRLFGVRSFFRVAEWLLRQASGSTIVLCGQRLMTEISRGTAVPAHGLEVALTYLLYFGCLLTLCYRVLVLAEQAARAAFGSSQLDQVFFVTNNTADGYCGYEALIALLDNLPTRLFPFGTFDFVETLCFFVFCCFAVLPFAVALVGWWGFFWFFGCLVI